MYCVLNAVQSLLQFLLLVLLYLTIIWDIKKYCYLYCLVGKQRMLPKLLK